MSRMVNMHEAKTHLSRLVDEASAGNEVLIARAGKPVARLVALADKPLRVLGVAAGQPWWMADDFDELPSDIAEAFGAE